MTFGDATEPSFCIKHKLLIRLKKIIRFLLRLRKEGRGRGDTERVLTFPHTPQCQPEPLWGPQLPGSHTDTHVHHCLKHTFMAASVATGSQHLYPAGCPRAVLGMSLHSKASLY